MKKFLSLLLTATMVLSLCTVFAVSGSALEAIDATTLGKPEDFTEQVKWATLNDVYSKKLPVVRADAILLPSDEFDYCTAPGSGTRTITITDWADRKLEGFFNDEFFCDDGVFGYYCVKWANPTTCGEWDDRGRMSIKFTVEEAGLYELVILGCAEVKEANLGNPEKERGFAYDIDGKGLAQVNITKTHGAFSKGYVYSYSEAELNAGYEALKDYGTSAYFEPTYYYGMTFDLTAGEHTLNFYSLFYFSDGSKSTTNGPRLNFMCAYVEKAVTDSEFENYKYPETEVVTEPVTTAAPVTEAATTAEAVETKAPETEAAKTEDVTIEANIPETEPAKKSGCGSAIGVAAVLALAPAALLIKRKRH